MSASRDLDNEREFLDELLTSGKLDGRSGQTAVVVDTKLVGVFATRAEARSAGLKVVGLDRPFLVAQISSDLEYSQPDISIAAGITR